MSEFFIIAGVVVLLLIIVTGIVAYKYGDFDEYNRVTNQPDEGDS